MLVSNVIKSLLGAGIKEFVVCAGARNLPLIESLMLQEDIGVWNHFEERSAGFFALGRTRASAEPCCVVTTSGTAVAEVLPAVIEAHYQGRPLVVLSADRPMSYRKTGAPQAIEQAGIFSDYVEICLDVEAGEIQLDQWSGRKPMHLNICLEEHEEISKDVYDILPFKQSRESINVTDLVYFIRDSWDGLIVAVGGLEPDDREEVYHFLKDLKAPVIADATSGLREGLGNLLVASPEKVLNSGMVGKVLRIGEVPVGRFWRDLENLMDVEVLSLSRTGFSGLSRDSKLIHGSITRILKGTGEVGSIGDVAGALSENTRDWAITDELLEKYPDSESGMIRRLSLYAACSSTMYLGNSLPIREWNQFAQRDTAMEFIYANRGANGIDGQISTWLGWTAGLEDSWCVLGDLTTLYDMSALYLLNSVNTKGRVLVVINNGGGKIFSRLERVKGLDIKVQNLIENNHDCDFSHLAALWGMKYAKFQSADEIDIEESDTAILIEIVPNAAQTESFCSNFKERL